MVANSGSHRVQKMASMIRGEIARLLISEVSDPRLKHVVITDVELTKDLRHARVYFGDSETADPKETVRGLNKAVAFFRRKLGANLELKYVPELAFEADKHASSVSRILSLIDQVQHGDSQ